MSIKLIIFDFDGTLGDTRRNIVTTMQMTIKELQLPSRTEAECAATIGLPLAGCFRTLFPDIQDELISRCAETYRRIFNENLQKITPEAFPGVVKTLKTLKEQFDTILMLMNGIGIVGTLDRLPKFFRQRDKLLAPGGQVLCDSSDISYVFEDERLRVGDGTSGMNGMIDIPNEMDYYGEHSFRMQYKDTIGEPFDWLYIDADTLKENAAKNGYIAEIVAEGDHYDYLARITKMSER